MFVVVLETPCIFTLPLFLPELYRSSQRDNELKMKLGRSMAVACRCQKQDDIASNGTHSSRLEVVQLPFRTQTTRDRCPPSPVVQTACPPNALPASVGLQFAFVISQ
jgi:hypothetical protein